MSRKYRNIGPETLEVVETAPLSLLQEIIDFQETDSEPSIGTVLADGQDDDDQARIAALGKLNERAVEALRPLEDRCRRIRRLSIGKGPTSLEHVAKQRLFPEQHEAFRNEPNELCRSAWVYLHHPLEFEDAEAFYAARQYRDHGNMYDSFEANVDDTIADASAAVDEDALSLILTDKLELSSPVSIRTLELPKTANHPPSVMVIVRHAGPLSSVFSHKTNGMRGTIYYRPPNEATLIWTPRDKIMEICGPSPKVRIKVGEAFAEEVLGADLSKKPLTWRHYDLSLFHESLNLQLPAWDDVELSAAKLIEVEMRLGNWSRRLSLRVTIDDDLEEVAKRYLGGNRLLKHAEGFSRLVVAVHYSRSGEGKSRTLEFSFSDRRSNLQSKSDPDERDLGYRLLQFWGVLNRLRELDHDEVAELLPHLLELHDAPEDAINGGQLRRMGLNAKRLLDGGIISHKGRQNVILLDKGDEFGDVEVGPTSKPDEMTATGSFGQDLGGVPLHDMRQYVIKRDWLEATLLLALKPLIGRSTPELLVPDLGYLGRWRPEGADIPVYFARRIGQPEILQKLDVILRSRQDAGVGIVLTAGRTVFRHLGPNVVVPVVEALPGGRIDEDAANQLLERFQANRWLALGGTEVAMPRYGAQYAMLYIPGKSPLPVSGHKQMSILERLVGAYKAGRADVPTGEIVEGTGVRSPADAWPSPSRKTVAGVYIENNRRGYWRLKTDSSIFL